MKRNGRKKLSLNKKTLRTLSGRELRGAVGGGIGGWPNTSKCDGTCSSAYPTGGCVCDPDYTDGTGYTLNCN